ncbi:interferon-induced GTP-binding protein Mx2-like [Ochotona curzoniae]|uniref:interferon-induced GTP-binding protein Mx2-like n=1 Tax=Ochotona curzoniae TaxID=130825 RepID=UPI001B3536C8|nr:interferon-induced GTP-binding protein Mx2-like [Ochotona curzoniae]
MSKLHRIQQQRKHSSPRSQQHPEQETTFLRPMDQTFVPMSREVQSSPPWLKEMNVPAPLPENISFLSLSEQQTPKAKESECNLYNVYEQKVRPCIDLIDSLRALGVEQDLALPAITVIGDQSSGKSSVLEALSGVALPRGSGIITRCPLELKMKKQPWDQAWNGTISYRGVRLTLKDPSHVEREIRKAQDIIAGSDMGISHELISLEITSGEVPDLTLIDLPGIARLPVGNQPQDIGKQIKALIRKYIQRQETINLVVVPCNVDIATTEALSMAREVDPDGDRTIGVLTKPDLVDRGTETGILQVMQNLTYHLKKGYMMVRCRAQQEILNELTCAEAIKKEMQFFQTHPYFRVLLEDGQATVPCLAKRLTKELSMHIRRSLPLLETQIRERYQQATEELCQYGEDIPKLEVDKILFLIKKVKLFNKDIEKLVEAEELVQGKETRMYHKVREEFKAWDSMLSSNNQQAKNSIQAEISKYESQYRGKELPGFISYKTFESIVQQHIRQLLSPALQVVLKTAEIVHQAFCEVAVKHFNDFFNLHQMVQNKIKNLKEVQMEKAERMVRLQFDMEGLIYCQDKIYSAVLQDVRQEASQPLAKPAQTLPMAILGTPSNPSAVSCKTEIATHVEAYCLEASKRLSNQIPLLVQFFILWENGDYLQKTMMEMLQEKDKCAWLLQEHGEMATKRQLLKDRIHRLSQARSRLWQFSKEGTP